MTDSELQDLHPNDLVVLTDGAGNCIRTYHVLQVNRRLNGRVFEVELATVGMGLVQTSLRVSAEGLLSDRYHTLRSRKKIVDKELNLGEFRFHDT